MKVSKVRRDLEITDPVLQKRLALAFGRRIVPAVAKAFSFETRRTTGFKIGRYGGEKGGYFRPHRDNLTAAVAHRRFAVSLLLNDPADYDGGALTFPEFGSVLYRAPAGAALRALSIPCAEQVNRQATANIDAHDLAATRRTLLAVIANLSPDGGPPGRTRRSNPLKPPPSKATP